VGTESTFRVIPDLSAVLIEARSSVGPIAFGTTALEGTVTATIADGGWAGDTPPRAAVTVDMTAIASGNSLYDAELARRIESRRFPKATVSLRDLTRVGSTSRYQAGGLLTLHGVTCALLGTVTVTTGEAGALVVEGEHVVDIRDFNIPSPTVLMLRIYPDVRVHLHLHLARTDAGPEPAPRGPA
jgi:polyisoprenoid-binding protein YceI